MAFGFRKVGFRHHRCNGGEGQGHSIVGYLTQFEAASRVRSISNSHSPRSRKNLGSHSNETHTRYGRSTVQIVRICPQFADYFRTTRQVNHCQWHKRRWTIVLNLSCGLGRGACIHALYLNCGMTSCGLLPQALPAGVSRRFDCFGTEYKVDEQLARRRTDKSLDPDSPNR